MTREQLTELIDFAKELKLEKESLQEVLYQKDFADQYSVDKYVYQLVVGLQQGALAPLLTNSSTDITVK